jgi:rhodanese-related sulfurtransferase
LLLAFLALVVGAVDSARRPVTVQAKPAATQATGTTPTTQAGSPVDGGVKNAGEPAALGKDITVAQAKALFDSGAMFIDARTDAEWGTGHIPQAVHLSGEMFSDGRALEVLRQLDPTGVTVIYCGGGDCHASEQVYILLQQGGFTQLHIFTDGVPGWTAAGHPYQATGVTP